jgi:DNA-binding MarR family transcriptional regulator
MNKKKASRELVASFIRLVNKYNALERSPLSYGTAHKFYHSERHMLDIVGDEPGLNITAFAQKAGVTKGAVSQVVTKLESKGALRRFKGKSNDKEIQLELTPLGERIYAQHQRVNQETINLLWDELEKHPQDKIAFLMEIFNWFEHYLDQSKEEMQEGE